ncbi:MAG: hypothetical protein IKC69_07995, partial [Clostridia bacterium]|nr:hypothetical protein [Clostridia bacterium]
MHNTLYLYISRTAGDARAASEGEKLRALDAFWKKTGLEPEEIVKTPQGKPVFPSGRFHLSV